jgi:hypothetical protein
MLQTVQAIKSAPEGSHAELRSCEFIQHSTDMLHATRHRFAAAYQVYHSDRYQLHVLRQLTC